MNKLPQPSKEEAKHWLKQQVSAIKSPDTKDIRRALGWGLVEASRDHQKDKY